MPERILLRIGGVSAVVGSILVLVLQVLVHPRTDMEADPEGALQLIAESNIWIGSHVGMIFAVLLVAGGLVGLYRSITSGAGAAWARLGFAILLAGMSVLLVYLGTDGIAKQQVAEAWVNAPEAEKAAAFRVALALNEIDQALLAIFMMVFFGVAFVLYGLAVVTSTVYPRWLGWLAVVGGVGTVLNGSLHAYGSSFDILILFHLLLLVWVLVMGILMWRKARGA